MSKREPCVYLSVDRDRLTGGIQLSINDEGGGYRIKGPKYCGESVSLLEHHLDERDVAELSSYLRKARRLLKRANAVSPSHVEPATTAAHRRN